MCGIVGFFCPESVTNKEILLNMMNKIIHRGPDDDGFYISENDSIAFRPRDFRLLILKEANNLLLVMMKIILSLLMGKYITTLS